MNLLSLVYKLFTKILVNHISDTKYFEQHREEAGFRKGYSRVNYIHTINEIMEKSAQLNKPIYIAFIDCEKAFDSVESPACTDGSIKRT